MTHRTILLFVLLLLSAGQAAGQRVMWWNWRTSSTAAMIR